MPTHGGVSRLVYGRLILVLLGEQQRLVFESHCHLVDGFAEVVHCHCFAVATSGKDSGLVAHVGNLGTTESRCLLSQFIDVDFGVNLDFAQVYLEDGFAVG